MDMIAEIGERLEFCPPYSPINPVISSKSGITGRLPPQTQPQSSAKIVVAKRHFLDAYGKRLKLFQSNLVCLVAIA
jgi:hypothetical protein